MNLKNRYVILTLSLFLFAACQKSNLDLVNLEKERVIKAADIYLSEQPVTVTDFICTRSRGGVHDFYSEGDYWWPNPGDPDGPYIRKDGLTNPDNFTAHRKAMRRLSVQVPALVAAWKVSGDAKYAEHALKHLNAWFVADATKMNPNLLYAQAIKGKVSGRGIGIIDTIHLVEVVQAIIVLRQNGYLQSQEYEYLKSWFKEYLFWMTTHPYGQDERDHGNNHSTCWAMQVAQFARFTENDNLLNYVREMYKTVLLPTQMDSVGRFPKELKRTKPYGYSLFNLDAMTMVCKIASSWNDNLWLFNTENGRGLQLALSWMYPYIDDKSSWPYEKDVMCFDDWPVRHPSLFFGGIAYNETKYLKTWKRLNADVSKDEVIRNFFIRQPLLWIE